jgi:hypothetical protein
MQNIAKKRRKTGRVGAREYWTNTLEERAPAAVPMSGIMLLKSAPRLLVVSTMVAPNVLTALPVATSSGA